MHRSYPDRRILAVGLLAASLTVPVTTSAQDFPKGFVVDTDVEERFVKFLTRGDHLTEVKRLWRLHTNAECEINEPPFEITPMALPTRVIGTLVQGLDDFFPARGTWEERWTGESCGVDVVLNFSFNTQDGETPPVGSELLPGFTKANFIVQPITEAAAVTVAGDQIIAAAGDRVDTSCRLNGDVIATEGVDGAQTALMDRRADDDNSWFEDWTVRLCGCETVIHVGFTQNFIVEGTRRIETPTLSDGSVPSFGQFKPQMIDGYIEDDGVWGVQYFAAIPDSPIAVKASADPIFQPPLPNSVEDDLNASGPVLPRLQGCPLL